MVSKQRKRWVHGSLLIFCAYCAACAVIRPFQQHDKSESGLLMDHPFHASEGMDCSDCHDMSDEEFNFPNHDLCSICHDIPEDEPTAEACMFCHTRPDYSIPLRTAALSGEILFSHDVHTAAEVSCSQCHANPDASPLPKGPLKPFCMECHTDLNEGQLQLAALGDSEVSSGRNMTTCSVCHKRLDVDVVPTFRGRARIAHDSPLVWETMHGQESRIDEKYCANCHDQRNDCMRCHETEAPRNHTVNWRRRTHGLMASWNRKSCATCHEEDSCMKCHQNTKPASHRAGFTGPASRHCTTCHYPEDSTNCTVCHQSIDHRSANRSIHLLGIYPPNCQRCHPGGLPTRAPHFMNSTVRCLTCHR